MKHKSWASPYHVGKITISILDKLSAEFHKEFAKEEKNLETLMKLAGSIGYQSQIYNGIQKTHDFAKRVEKIEATLQVADPETLAMGLNPVIIAEQDQRTTFALR